MVFGLRINLLDVLKVEAAGGSVEPTADSGPSGTPAGSASERIEIRDVTGLGEPAAGPPHGGEDAPLLALPSGRRRKRSTLPTTRPKGSPARHRSRARTRRRS